MLLYLFVPLFVAWLFAKFKFKRIFLTYFVSSLIIISIPVSVFVIRFLAMANPDFAAIAFDKSVIVNLFGEIALALFVTLFFQYIFNKTFGLKRS